MGFLTETTEPERPQTRQVHSGKQSRQCRRRASQAESRLHSFVFKGCCASPVRGPGYAMLAERFTPSFGYRAGHFLGHGLGIGGCAAQAPADQLELPGPQGSGRPRVPAGGAASRAALPRPAGPVRPDRCGGFRHRSRHKHAVSRVNEALAKRNEPPLFFDLHRKHMALQAISAVPPIPASTFSETFIARTWMGTSKRRLIVHVGTPKTGTSSLQYHLVGWGPLRTQRRGGCAGAVWRPKQLA